jgi:hypothetical protein
MTRALRLTRSWPMADPSCVQIMSVAGVGPIHSRIFTGTRRIEKKQAHLRAWHALA